MRYSVDVTDVLSVRTHDQQENGSEIDDSQSRRIADFDEYFGVDIAETFQRTKLCHLVVVQTQLGLFFAFAQDGFFEFHNELAIGIVESGFGGRAFPIVTGALRAGKEGTV